MKNEHPNRDIILLKLQELRREEIPLSARKILDSVEKLVVSKPNPLLVPNDRPDEREQAQHN